MLAARDGGCVNCGSPVEGTEPHHIEWFSRGGATDVDNLALLCERCHHLIHDDNWQLHKHKGQHKLQPPAHPRPHERLLARAAPERNLSFEPDAPSPRAMLTGLADMAEIWQTRWVLGSSTRTGVGASNPPGLRWSRSRCRWVSLVSGVALGSASDDVWTSNVRSDGHFSSEPRPSAAR